MMNAVSSGLICAVVKTSMNVFFLLNSRAVKGKRQDWQGGMKFSPKVLFINSALSDLEFFSLKM
jgi:hypothetical protein